MRRSPWLLLCCLAALPCGCGGRTLLATDAQAVHGEDESPPPAPDADSRQPDWGACACRVKGVCLDAGERDATHCLTCDPTRSTTDWSAAAYGCKINYGSLSLCFDANETDGTTCRLCDPVQSTTGWTLTLGPDQCWIAGLCAEAGWTSSSQCGLCDPTKNALAWTPLPHDCAIGGQCYTSGETDGMGCGVCDPSKSTTTWTPTYDCKIGGVCYQSGATDNSGCGVCDPSKSATGWSPVGPLKTALTDDFSDGSMTPWMLLSGAVGVVGGVLSVLTDASGAGKAERSLPSPQPLFIDVEVTLRLATASSLVALCIGHGPTWTSPGFGYYCVTLTGGTAPGARVYYHDDQTGWPGTPLVGFPFAPGVNTSHVLRLTRNGGDELELFVDGIARGKSIDTQVGDIWHLLLLGQDLQGGQPGHGGALGSIVVKGC